MPALRSEPSRAGFALSRASLWVVVIAFVVGLLCFLGVWLAARKDDVVVVAPVAAAVTPPAPLPAPLPAGGDGAAEMAEAPPSAPRSADTPAPVELLPEPADLATTDERLPAPATVSAAPAVDRTQPLPIQGQMPAPAYPAAALRQGDAGTVVVRVDVNADGTPGDVALIQRSGSRALDRAAMDAVRRWRFQPALRDGQAVTASIEVPFEFKSGR